MRYCLLLFALSLPSAALAQHDSTLVNRAFGNVEPIASSEVDPELPPGTVRVRVLDEQGSPVAGAAVRLGIMQTSGARESKACVTTADGLCEFSDLSMESGFSYRASVPFEGARYGSMPFRLDPNSGQKVTVRRLPTTSSDRSVFQVVGRTMIEFREDRARITQDAQLANLGNETYVFPEGGLGLRLPDGFSGFDSRKVMTDQRLSATDEGLSINGSLPPGRVHLTWAYELPLTGSSFELEHPIPFATMEYHVMSDYLDGMTLEVEGFPVGSVVDGGDRRFVLTRRTRRPSDPPLEDIRIVVRGIPHSRTIPLAAAVIAAILALLGLNMLLRPRVESTAITKLQGQRREELLDEIVRLEREHQTEQVGPKYYERRRRELRDELAIALRAQHEALDD